VDKGGFSIVSDFLRILLSRSSSRSSCGVDKAAAHARTPAERRVAELPTIGHFAGRADASPRRPEHANFGLGDLLHSEDDGHLPVR
jgi:hypothetical protein